MPVAHWEASLIGTISPVAVSVSSSGSSTMKSSSGSRVTSLMRESGSSTPMTLALQAPRGDDALEELLRPLLERRGEDLLRRPLLEHDALVEEADAVGDLAREAHL